jgi:hypothetical protein
VTAEEILAKARADGVDVVLTTAGDGLELLSAGDQNEIAIAQRRGRILAVVAHQAHSS